MTGLILIVIRHNMYLHHPDIENTKYNTLIKIMKTNFLGYNEYTDVTLDKINDNNSLIKINITLDRGIVASLYYGTIGVCNYHKLGKKLELNKICINNSYYPTSYTAIEISNLKPADNPGAFFIKPNVGAHGDKIMIMTIEEIFRIENLIEKYENYVFQREIKVPLFDNYYKWDIRTYIIISDYNDGFTPVNF